MTTPEEPGEQRDIQVSVPEAIQAGAYAGGAMVWHTAHEFTLDFIQILPPYPESPGTVQCLVTSRVKIPPTVIFDLLRALNDNMTKYEAKFGEIPRVQRQDQEEEAE
jgi:hypothetical protein